MTKLTRTVLVIAVVALVAMPAFAQTPRMNATGGGFAAVSIDETASFYNPAGLPLLQTFGSRISPWPSRASVNLLIDGPSGYDEYSAFYASRKADNTSGWGASYGHSKGGSSTDMLPASYGQRVGSDFIVGKNGSSIDMLSLGYGRRIGEGLTAGASLYHASNGDDATSFDLGIMYRREIALNAWRFGLWTEDVIDEYGGPFVHLGAAIELPAGVDIAATFFDLTDEIDSTFSFGAEWNIPMTSFIVRAGNNDGDFTAGAAYQASNLEFGVSWEDLDTDWVTIGVTGCF